MDAPHSPWHGRRVLVTGCTGFLGGAVARELLDRGADVIGLIRTPHCDLSRHRNFRPIHGRLEDSFRLYSALAVHEVQTVFHLAASGVFAADPGASAVIEAVRRFDPRVPVVTAHPSDGLQLAQRNPPVPLGVARFGEVFGPGDRKALRIVPSTITSLLRGTTAQRPDSAPCDFVFVRDAGRACLALAESLTPEPQLCDETFRSGWELTDRQAATAIRDVFDARAALFLRTEPATNPCGWQPSLSFADAVNETIAWQRDRAEASREPHRKAA